MNKPIIVTVLVVSVAFIVGTFFVVRSLVATSSQSSGQQANSTNVDTTSGTTGFGSSGNAGGNTSVVTPITNGITITSKNGDTVTVKDFVHDQETVQDPANKNTMYLGFHPYEGFNDPTATDTYPYNISYFPATNVFNVVLLQEPLSQARLAAEAYLKQHLGIGETQLCQLRYSVFVPERVNQIYAGRDLRFSFCPDATPL